MTKQEEILNKHVSLYFSSHHDRSQWNGEGEHGGAEWHTDKAIAADIYKAMDEYAKQQAIAFLKRHITFSDTKIYEEMYNKLVEDQFIEQQNK